MSMTQASAPYVSSASCAATTSAGHSCAGNNQASCLSAALAEPPDAGAGGGAVPHPWATRAATPKINLAAFDTPVSRPPSTVLVSVVGRPLVKQDRSGAAAVVPGHACAPVGRPRQQ